MAMVCVLDRIRTGKAAARGWISHVDTQANGTHGGHGDDVEPSSLEPLSEAWSGVVR